MSDKKGYIPKDQRKKILFLADDMRVTSGVGTMAREIIEGTVHRFNWVQIGAAVSHPEAGKILDLSDSVNQELNMTDASVKIIPYNGYGDSRLVRQILEVEQPDAILHFTDPRYWIWLYQMEHEIRQNIPMFFYAIWDDLPYPYYNENFYRSDDWIGCISKQTYNIVKHVSRKEPRAPWSLTYVPHGINVRKYYPIADNDSELLETRKALFGEANVEYVVLYNSRNIRRKMTSDILLSFDHFIKQLPPEKQEKCRLVMHTQKLDEHGTDLPVVIRDVVPGIEKYIVWSEARMETKYLCNLYNIADVTINLSSNEGFGLGTCESIICGTPIIVNVTGGLQDQCGFVNDNGEYLNPENDFTYEWGSNADGRFRKHGEWAFPVFPVSRSLQGSPLTPYIFDDRASWTDAGDRLLEVYNLGREERKRRGELGRQYALGAGQFTAERMCELFIQDMEAAWENWTPRKRFTLLKV